MELENLRIKVDEANKKIIEALKERFVITRKIGKIKARENLNSVDKNREEIVIASMRQLAKENDLDEVMVEKVFRIIMEKAVAEHDKIKDYTRSPM